jgi:hypothetical protein
MRLEPCARPRHGGGHAGLVKQNLAMYFAYNM